MGPEETTPLQTPRGHNAIDEVKINPRPMRRRKQPPDHQERAKPATALPVMRVKGWRSWSQFAAVDLQMRDQGAVPAVSHIGPIMGPSLLGIVPGGRLVLSYCYSACTYMARHPPTRNKGRR